jgi:ubiquinone/menaquinone biosynthesis C-methylase UbiE
VTSPAEYKDRQRETWSLGNFGDVAAFTTPAAGKLVRFAGVTAGESVLDVGCGTGVVAVTAARLGARVSGLDLTPFLLDQARRNSGTARVQVDWREGDAEALPWPEASFDVVLSQFGHMFAPRPEVAAAELLRVLKPGGRLAFSTWPPEQFVGRAFALAAEFVPPPPGIPAPALWGEVPTVVRRLGPGAEDLRFERGIMEVPVLSPDHYFEWQTAKVGPFIRALAALQVDPARLAEFRRRLCALVEEHSQDNVIRQEYLMTRARKA